MSVTHVWVYIFSQKNLLLLTTSSVQYRWGRFSRSVPSIYRVHPFLPFPWLLTLYLPIPVDSLYAFDPEVEDFLPAMALHGQNLGLAVLHSFGIVAKDNKDVTHLSSLALAATTKAPQLGVVFSTVEMYFHSSQGWRSKISLCSFAFLPSLFSVHLSQRYDAAEHSWHSTWVVDSVQLPCSHKDSRQIAQKSILMSSFWLSHSFKRFTSK